MSNFLNKNPDLLAVCDAKIRHVPNSFSSEYRLKVKAIKTNGNKYMITKPKSKLPDINKDGFSKSASYF